MKNTFWTLIDNEYYRVHNEVLRYAPANQTDNAIDASQESKVEVITPERLELVNEVLGCSFIVDDF